MAVAALRAFGAGLREVFTLREATRVARAQGPTLEGIRADKARARAQLRAARTLARPLPALLVLDGALSSALAALHRARGATEPMSLDGELDWLAQTAPELAARETVSLREAVAADDFAAAEDVRERVDRLVDALLRMVAARTPVELAALRWGRAAAVALGVVYFGTSYARTHWLVHNVALHKPVTTSPLRVTPPTPDAVVDGRTRGTFGVHTVDGHAFVTIDLERTYTVREIRVFNRGDGWFDDVLPLTLSVSLDGLHFDTVAVRTTHFDVWDVKLVARPARYVRVSKDTGYIALNEIEVYARE